MLVYNPRTIWLLILCIGCLYTLAFVSAVILPAEFGTPVNASEKKNISATLIKLKSTQDDRKVNHELKQNSTQTPAELPAELNYSTPDPNLLSKIKCKAFLLVEADSGRVLGAYNENQPMAIASLTKLTTAILAQEFLSASVSYPLLPQEKKYLKTDTITRHELLQLMLIPSNNLACQIVARLIKGDEKTFAQYMTNWGKQQGLTSTTYYTASGLNIPQNNVSSARDVMLMYREAQRYPELSLILQMDAAYHNGIPFKHTLHRIKEFYPQIRAGKTGYTRQAGGCRAITIESNGNRYYFVLLGSPNPKVADVDTARILSAYGILPPPPAELLALDQPATPTQSKSKK